MGFSSQIISWYEQHQRKLPWRETRDPYLIWVSEVILQQTRVEQGLAYYNNFIARFPDIQALADTPEEEVLKIWQGLGYYSRARNMHHAAKEIMAGHGGIFPSSYQEIRALKGIGDYSASAVASFAFNLPFPVMDGNVIRLISRLFGITDPVNLAPARNRIREILSSEIDRERPALFNQAIMEFGALGCTPARPFCHSCPLASNCFALRNDIVSKIPLKEKKSESKERCFHYLIFILNENNQVFTVLNKRSGKDIWKNLYEFPMIEADKLLDWEEITRCADWINIYPGRDYRLLTVSGAFRHVLSHRKLTARYFMVSCKVLPEGFVRVGQKDLSAFPVPKLMERIISHSNITFFRNE